MWRRTAKTVDAALVTTESTKSNHESGVLSDSVKKTTKVHLPSFGFVSPYVGVEWFWEAGQLLHANYRAVNLVNMIWREEATQRGVENVPHAGSNILLEGAEFLPIMGDQRNLLHPSVLLSEG